MRLLPDALLQRLKRETSAQHAEVEATLDAAVGLTRPDVRLDDYVRFLAGMLGVYRPLEQALREVEGLSASLCDMDLRWKEARLEADLEALGLGAGPRGALPLSPLPPFAAGVSRPPLPEALGCLYVLEGSTLGGVFIHRHLVRTLGARVESACRFLRPYGDGTGPMWKAFGAAVTTTAAGLDADARIVDGACQTFKLMTGWFGRLQVSQAGEVP